MAGAPRTACRGGVAQSLHLRQVPAPSWPPHGHLERMSSQDWRLCDHDTLIPACLGQHRAQLSSEEHLPAPGQNPDFSRGQLQGLTHRDARWQGKQPLSFHEGVLRQMEPDGERSRHWDIGERRWGGS